MSLTDLTAKIADLHQSMERELVDRVRVFEDADMATIRREAHKLRGSFPHQKKLTRLAEWVEKLAAAGEAAGGEEGPARRAAVVLCEEARRISRASGQTAPSGQAAPTVQVAPSVQATPMNPTGPSGRAFRILVVDDDDAIRRLTMISLTRLGGHAVSAAEGMSGVLEQASAGHFDLIIADAMMPRSGGVELALSLRTRAISVPVVVLSAAAPEELGATDHGLTWWRKPISPHELVRRVAMLLL